MPSTTTNYGLHTFNTTTDKTQAFELFRDYLAGVGTNSNMYIIDGKLKEWKDLIDGLTARQGVIRVPMQYDGTNHYSASGITGISVAYTTGMAIVVIPDTTNDGTTQVNINSLGNLTLVKIDSDGVVGNLTAGDLVINHQYLFVYDGTNLVWITPNTLDQIHAVGTVGNLITINADNNLEDSGLALDDDPLLAADSDALIPSQKAVKAYADAIIPNANALMYKGVIDCSTNPDYPAASAGWLYVVSVAGKIGGASGITVESGDMALCKTDDTPSGDQATVGAFWNVVQRNIDGAVVNNGTGTSEAVAVFDGATGKIIKDGAAPGTAGNVLISTGTAWSSNVITTLSANVAFSGDITPSQITSNQNNYSPTGLSTAVTLRLDTDASRDITGLAGGADGRIIIIANIGSFNIVLKHESSSSTAGNRFILSSATDVTLTPNQDVMLQYDSTSSRWRLIGGTGSGSGGAPSNRSWFGV